MLLLILSVATSEATTTTFEIHGQHTPQLDGPAISLRRLGVVVIFHLRHGPQHEVTDVVAVAQEAEQGADVAFAPGKSPAIRHALELTQCLQLMIKLLWIHYAITVCAAALAKLLLRSNSLRAATLMLYTLPKVTGCMKNVVRLVRPAVT